MTLVAGLVLVTQDGDLGALRRGDDLDGDLGVAQGLGVGRDGLTVDEEQGRLTVELTTAYELDDDEAKSIVATIEQASGRTVEATRAVDPDLIGGMILQAGSFRVDASVRGRLDRLRRELVTRT